MAAIKKYNGSTFVDAAIRKYSTASEIIVPPTTIYCDGSNITTYTIKGNTVQNGTPTPSDPVPVVGVGELETTGEHTGEYKIPILNGQTALTPVYLTEPLMKISSMNDELNSNNILLRKIRKMVCNGSENWNVYSAGTSVSFFYLSVSANKGIDTVIMCTHYERKGIDTVTSTVGIDLVSDGTIMRLRPQNVASDFPDLNSWTTYLQQQYENGTPVTIWYALNTATTETVTVPSIPTTEGANSITVDTTVQPSEFTATWTGWHDAYVKEKSENLWDEDYTNISSDIYYKPVYVGDYEIVTVSSTVSLTSQNFANLFALGGQQSSGASTGDNGVYSGRAIAIRPVDGYITIAYRNANGVNPQDYDTMVNEGRTAQTYAPYWE